MCSFFAKKKNYQYLPKGKNFTKKNIKPFQQKSMLKKKTCDCFSKIFKNYICFFSMETFAMTTLILALSLSRWQLHQEFLLEEKIECPPTDHRKTIPTSPRKNPCLYRNMFFCRIQGSLLRWRLGGLNWRQWKKRSPSPLWGWQKGHTRTPATVESDSCGTTGCAKNCRRTGLGLQPSSNTTGTFPSLLVFWTLRLMYRKNTVAFS